ncbi:DUF1772 domain-containing protein [Arthrobacter sp. E3]|uniref:DUF1772 domain-containing protein n=1 Tax=Arthrobacter sp. E3 TaxID=517402 RepID=UPI001A94C019|nr:DUF1772 domain-containing protein [Arthrobacter sp. E3]
MVIFVLSLNALVLIAVLLGIQLFGQVAFNPALRAVDATVYIQIKQSFDITAPRIAKPVMLLCLAAALATLVTALVSSSMMVIGASALSLSALVIALLAVVRGDLPINQTMANWSAEEPPENWRAVRTRWERFFALRTGATCLALIATVVAALASATELS